MKHLEVKQKYSAECLMLDILLHEYFIPKWKASIWKENRPVAAQFRSLVENGLIEIK